MCRRVRCGLHGLRLRNGRGGSALRGPLCGRLALFEVSAHRVPDRAAVDRQTRHEGREPGSVKGVEVVDPVKHRQVATHVAEMHDQPHKGVDPVTPALRRQAFGSGINLSEIALLSVSQSESATPENDVSARYPSSPSSS